MIKIEYPRSQRDLTRGAARDAVNRRSLLAGLVGLSAGMTAGTWTADRFNGAQAWVQPNTQGVSRPQIELSGTQAEAYGPTQPGVDRPQNPQPHALLTILDVHDPDSGPQTGDGTALGRLREVLGAVGTEIARLMRAKPGEVSFLPGGASTLTVTVGIGPRLVSLLSPDLPGGTGLPEFAGDKTISAWNRGGDVVIAVHSDDPTSLHPVAEHLRAYLPHHELRWQQQGARGLAEGAITRNPLGFHDGIMGPSGDDEISRHVSIKSGRMDGGTIMVIRRLRLDVAGWNALAVRDQEAVIGRGKVSGAPLSGGDLHSEVNLLTKTPDGQYLTPKRSHVRAAHPSFTDSALMLRRGYGFANGVLDDGTMDAGLLFVSYQNSLDTFVRTQRRLDETDDLMRFVTPSASASFLVLPGYDENRHLGASLTTSSEVV